MIENLLTVATDLTLAAQSTDSALSEALRVSGIALLAIFFVMGLFGLMIKLLSLLFPDANDEQQ